MFGRRTFGRKATAAPAEPMRPATPPAGKIFDDEIFEGERGDFLRSAGYFPADPINDAANAQPLAVLLGDDAAHLRQVTAAAKAVIAAPLAPYQLIPVEVWRGPHGAWLRQRLGLSPYRPWNTLYLAEGPAAVAEFGLPLAERQRDAQEVAFGMEMVAAVHDHLAGAQDGATQAMITLFKALRENLAPLLPPERADMSPPVREGRDLVRAAAIGMAVNFHFPSIEQIQRSHALTLAQPEVQLTA
ncbi:hypothetical protein [Sphingomonas astaxanthinifaciens]|uniref:Uncharacterized protein n=1 Tax=Sphingomonas astaxanthinifaciens DSM 22298 TaxID=1123267 RepID=A0ABQ5Z5Z2_9SPHN|nr:hypothetical protein [Sphingomonas astaxanthinifaciens]GLR46323.1 hypothetical protein GCM10007925_00340 [Sphingomonas astaxanthinifaciens DSM 22298]